MTPTRTRLPVAAVVVYAALGVALGMVLWALVLHGDGREAGSGDGVPFQVDGKASDEAKRPPRGDGG